MNFNPNTIMKQKIQQMISQRFGSVDNMMNDMVYCQSFTVWLRNDIGWMQRNLYAIFWQTTAIS